MNPTPTASTLHHALAQLADTAAVLAFAWLMHSGTLQPATAIPAILAVLAGRLWPRPVAPTSGSTPSDPNPPVSGAATILALAGSAFAFFARHKLAAVAVTLGLGAALASSCKAFDPANGGSISVATPYGSATARGPWVPDPAPCISIVVQESQTHASGDAGTD